MSIYAYTGLPGSGKSYSVVEHQILPAMKAGRRVVTNVCLRVDKLRADFPGGELVELPTLSVQANPDSIYEYVTPGSVLILDEVWRLFPAGLKANHVPEAFRKLLAEHRHMVDAAGNSCQIVLVTQDLAQISAFARQLVESTFRTVKLTSVGLQKQFRVDVYNGPAVGPNPPENSRLRQIFGHFRSDVWQYYESHTMKAEGPGAASVNEKSVDRRANILFRPVFLVGMIAAPLMILGGLYKLRELVKSQQEPEAVAVVEDSTPAQDVYASGRIIDPGPSMVAPQPMPGGAAQVVAQLVGVIQNLDTPARSVALVRVQGRTVMRPLSYCQNNGWWTCDFPDFGRLSL